MLSLLRRWGARAFPSNSRARRRQASSPLQGPPGTRPVRGLRTLRSFVSASVPIPPALHPLSAQPPATSTLRLVSRIGGVRGRKVPVRRASVLLDRSEPAGNVSAVRGACRLTQLRCWVVPGRDSSSSAGSVRRVPAQAPEAVCPRTPSVSSAAPGSLKSPFRGAPEPAAPTPSRPPPGPRSTSFRALWHWQTHSRRTRPPPQPSRLRDCQHHRPAQGLPLQRQ